MAESWLQKIRQGFSRTFWVANTLELFERLAYYGSKAILVVYVAEQVGMGPEKAGWLVGSLFNTLLYLLPILAGTVVDRFGFKKSLMVCFSIFTFGYFLIGFAGIPAGQAVRRKSLLHFTHSGCDQPHRFSQGFGAQSGWRLETRHVCQFEPHS